MKVAYITMQFPVPSETFATNDVRALSKLGTEIDIYGLRPIHPEAQKLLQERDLGEVGLSHSTPSTLFDGVKLAFVHPLRSLDLFRWILKMNWRKPIHLLKSLALVPRSLEIAQELTDNEPDVVHIYWGHYPSMVGYLVRRYAPTIPVTISLVAYDLEMAYGGTKWLVHHVDKIRTLADINITRIKEIYSIPESRIEVIYDSVDIVRLNPYLSDSGVPRRVISVGRLVDGKGMADVIEIFAAIVARYPDASLVILGDGPEKQKFENRCSELGITEFVTFAGHVNHDQVLQEMAKAELFIFMSKKKAERLPNVVKEAMLAECICVVSNTIGIRELILDENYGFVVPLDGVEKAIEFSLQTLSDGFERERMKHNAKKHIIDNFNLERSANQYVNLWKSLIKGKN